MMVDHLKTVSGNNLVLSSFSNKKLLWMVLNLQVQEVSQFCSTSLSSLLGATISPWWPQILLEL